MTEKKTLAERFKEEIDQKMYELHDSFPKNDFYDFGKEVYEFNLSDGSRVTVSIEIGKTPEDQRIVEEQ